jgi:hypothetical protein
MPIFALSNKKVKDMNNIFNKNSKHNAMPYFIAGLCLIIGETFETILKNTSTTGIGHGIFWFCFTMAVFSIAHKRPFSTRSRIFSMVATTILVVFLLISILGFILFDFVYPITGVLIATALCHLIDWRMKKKLNNNIIIK